MGQGFKFKFEQARENKQENANPDKQDAPEQNSYVRNLCFVWPNGRKKFFSYSYLITGEYDPEKSTITLTFTSDTVIMKGLRLDALFSELLSLSPKKIVCADERYNSLVEDDWYLVNEIEIIRNE